MFGSQQKFKRKHINLLIADKVKDALNKNSGQIAEGSLAKPAQVSRL
jgi:hypothetical protein